MKIIQGDIWEVWRNGKTVAITTNGFVKKSGCATMGRGVAKQALEKVDHTLDRRLGRLLTEHGNRVFKLAQGLLTFPVKLRSGICTADKSNVVYHMRNKFEQDDFVPGWALMADLDRIKLSVMELRMLHNHGFIGNVWMPKPGCGAGGLKWADVKPMIDWVGDWLTICDLKG